MKVEVDYWENERFAPLAVGWSATFQVFHYNHYSGNYLI